MCRFAHSVIQKEYSQHPIHNDLHYHVQATNNCRSLSWQKYYTEWKLKGNIFVCWFYINIHFNEANFLGKKQILIYCCEMTAWIFNPSFLNVSNPACSYCTQYTYQFSASCQLADSPGISLFIFPKYLYQIWERSRWPSCSGVGSSRYYCRFARGRVAHAWAVQ